MKIHYNHPIPRQGYSTWSETLPKRLFLLVFTVIASLFLETIFTTKAQAYTNEVRQSGANYIWRINNVDVGTTPSISTAINNCMGLDREIHVLAGGNMTGPLFVPATGVKLYCHNNTFYRTYSGTGIQNIHNGFEVYDMILRGGADGYGIRCSRASNLKFVNVQIYDCPWIGMRIDSRESNPWNYWIYNLTVQNCIFENIGDHGLETYSIDGVNISNITARNTNGCGVLLNQTINGTLGVIDAYRCNNGGGYAGLRFANSCSNITAQSLIANECGRGYFVLSGSNNCHLLSAQTTNCTSIGIWLENVVNCTVAAGCSNCGVAVTGTGSYATVSNTCSSGPTYYKIQNRATGLILDGMGLTINGSTCGQYASNSTHYNAQWELVNTTGYTRLRNRGTGLFLDGMGYTANGNVVGQWANTTHVNAQWTWLAYSGAYARIQNRATGMFIDGGGLTANGSNATQWANTTHYNAQWRLIPVAGPGAGLASAKEREALSLSLIETEVNNELKVYPNPASSILNISLPADIKNGATFKLLDVAGKLVEKGNISGTTHKLNVELLSPGVYVLIVEDGANVYKEKVSIK